MIGPSSWAQNWRLCCRSCFSSNPLYLGLALAVGWTLDCWLSLTIGSAGMTINIGMPQICEELSKSFEECLIIFAMCHFLNRYCKDSSSHTQRKTQIHRNLNIETNLRRESIRASQAIGEFLVSHLALIYTSISNQVG
jgi:hypothetical protein